MGRPKKPKGKPGRPAVTGRWKKYEKARKGVKYLTVRFLKGGELAFKKRVRTTSPLAMWLQQNTKEQIKAIQADLRKTSEAFQARYLRTMQELMGWPSETEEIAAVKYVRNVVDSVFKGAISDAVRRAVSEAVKGARGR